MKNEEKFKTADDRVKAYLRHKGLAYGSMGHLLAIDYFGWLELEYGEEKPKPCYECGGNMVGEKGLWRGKDVCYLRCSSCGHSTGSHIDFLSATITHNRMSLAVDKARKDGLI